MKPKKKTAVKAVKKTEAATVSNAPETGAAKRFKVWENGWEHGARIVAADEPTAAALDYCAAAYPEPECNRCASVSMSEAALFGRVRVFLRDSKPVPYVFTEEVK